MCLLIIWCQKCWNFQISKFSGGACPQIPLGSGAWQPLVHTVGYSSLTSRLLQILLKPQLYNSHEVHTKALLWCLSSVWLPQYMTFAAVFLNFELATFLLVLCFTLVFWRPVVLVGPFGRAVWTILRGHFPCFSCNPSNHASHLAR